MAWALDNIEGMVLVLLIIINVVGCFFFFNLWFEILLKYLWMK